MHIKDVFCYFCDLKIVSSDTCCWLSFCLHIRARQTCWSTLRARPWTLCVRSTVQLSPVGSVRTERLPPSSNTTRTTSRSRSRYSSSLRLSPTHSPHRCISPKLSPYPTPHHRLISIPFPNKTPSYQLSLWFKLFQNHLRILNPHPSPSSSISTRASSRGQQVLWTPSPRKRRPARILWDPADPQPVPTEKLTQRETERAR